jgi:hypothetical protein
VSTTTTSIGHHFRPLRCLLWGSLQGFWSSRWKL